MDAVVALSTAMATSWISGVNLYATVATLGLLHRFGFVELPGSLDVLGNWGIIGLALALYLVEFVADKVPYVDSAWDAAHTFIRVPAAAVLAYGAATNLDPAVGVAAFLIGGGVALTAHGSKAAARLAINASPEPITNSAASIAEDGIVISLAALIAFHPIVAAAIVLAIVGLSLYLLPKILRLFAAAVRRVGSLGRRRVLSPLDKLPR